MKRPLFWSPLLLLLALLLWACGGTQPSTNTGGSAPTGSTTEAETPAAETPAAETEDPEAEGADAGAPEENPLSEEMSVMIAEFLSLQTGLPMDEMSIVSAKAQEWPDSSLGCPQPDMMYNPVLTPGYLVIAEVKGEEVTIHTNEDGSQIVLCTTQTEGGDTEGDTMAEPVTLEGKTAEVAALAIDKLVTETGRDMESFAVTAAEEQMWNDASLGCPQPDQMYQQVITPGYKFTIESEGESFALHTNSDGSNIVICKTDS